MKRKVNKPNVLHKKPNVGLSKAEAARVNGAKGGRPPAEVNVDGEVAFAGSLLAAEALWGIPKHILQWAKNSGCPAFHGSRVHKIVKDWLAKNPYPGEGEGGGDIVDGEVLPDKNTLERIKLKKQIRNIDLEHDKEAGLLVTKSDTKDTWARAMEVVMATTQAFLGKDEYNAWARQVKSGLKGLDL